MLLRKFSGNKKNENQKILKKKIILPMIKSFPDFLSEDISYTRGNYGLRDFDVEQLLPQTLEELKRKTGLKKGDPVKFTGNRYLLSLEVQGESLRTDVLKGEDLNSKELSFERWLDEKELQKLSELKTNLGQSFWWEAYGRGRKRDHLLSTFASALLASCRTPKGEEMILSFFTYNPKYTKSEPKVPEVFTREELEALCEKILTPAGLEFSIGTNPDYRKRDTLAVTIRTYYVAVRDNVGESRVAGPFGTEAAAEKRMKELGETQGDLDLKLLKDLKVRVDASQTPSEFFILRGESDITDQEFTRTLKKLYNTEELLKMMRGKITGKKFNI
jgi:hypothetical protein